MNNKSNFFYLVIIGLIFIAGTINGFFWSDYDIPIKWIPELKAGDLIALLISIITFTFAYKGFEDNREQFQLSNKPFLREFCFDHGTDYEVKFVIQNLGNGIALDFNWQFFLDGRLVDFVFIEKVLAELCCEKTKIYSGVTEQLSSGDELQVFRIQFGNTENFQNEYKECINLILNRLRVNLSYQDIFKNEYLLSIDGFRNKK